MTAAVCASGCGQPSPGAAICRDCTAMLRRDLRRLPQLDRDLEALMDPRRTITYGSGGSGGGLPYHEPAAECRSQVAHDLRYWAAQVTMARQLTAPAVTIAAMAGWLCGQVPWIAGRPWSADMADALAADAGRAMALLDPLRRARIQLPGSCPQCGASGAMAATVYQDEGDLRPSVIGCAGCGHQWDTTQWLRLGHVILQQQKAA